jgi:hypothetical protein
MEAADEARDAVRQPATEGDDASEKRARKIK